MTQSTHQAMGWGPQSPAAAVASQRARARWAAQDALKDAHRWATRNPDGHRKRPPLDLDLVRAGDQQITAVLLLYASDLALGDVFWNALLAILAGNQLDVGSRRILVEPLQSALTALVGEAP